MASLPIRTRGLKRPGGYPRSNASLSPPPRGAWIETRYRARERFQGPVAPRTGAWIEKPYRCLCLRIYKVAPSAGAWIETAENDMCEAFRSRSPSVRRRFRPNVLEGAAGKRHSGLGKLPCNAGIFFQLEYPYLKNTLFIVRWIPFPIAWGK